jgi:fatty-acyl-CoA synthase
MQKLKKSYFIGEGKGQLLYETIGSCFERVAKANPKGLAIIVKHQGIRWSYQELYEQVDRLSVGLLALGIQSGDRVGIWGPNSIEWEEN